MLCRSRFTADVTALIAAVYVYVSLIHCSGFATNVTLCVAVSVVGVRDLSCVSANTVSIASIVKSMLQLKAIVGSSTYGALLPVMCIIFIGYGVVMSYSSFVAASAIRITGIIEAVVFNSAVIGSSANRTLRPMMIIVLVCHGEIVCNSSGVTANTVCVASVIKAMFCS